MDRFFKAHLFLGEERESEKGREGKRAREGKGEVERKKREIQMEGGKEGEMGRGRENEKEPAC